MTDMADVLRIYQGSDGAATRALFAELGTLGSIGLLAVNLFRACKASERAKEYRRGYAAVAYEKKQWAMANLCASLCADAAAFGIAWGWGVDLAQPVYRRVLYIDLPTWQVSFHTAERGRGPDYPGQWDGAPGQSAGRVCAFVGRLLNGRAFLKMGEVLGLKESQSHGILNPLLAKPARFTDESRIKMLAENYLRGAR